MAGGSTFITDAMWWLWNTCLGFIPGVRLGGIYANKPGYHNTVAGNASWDYSVQLPLDQTAPGDKARAIDLTMDNTQMLLRTGYLQASALHPEDNRLYAVREFYGTLDTYTVYGLIQTGSGDWSPSTSDSSHLWHDHISVFTEYCDDMDAMKAIASVLSGQSWEAWNQGGSGDDIVLTAIQTKDTNGHTIILLPWMHGWFRITKEKIAENRWNLQNAIDALTFAGVGVDTLRYPGPYDFANPDLHMWWGTEIKFGGGVGPAGPPGAKGDQGAKGDPGEDGLGAGDSVTIIGTVQ